MQATSQLDSTAAQPHFSEMVSVTSLSFLLRSSVSTGEASARMDILRAPFAEDEAVWFGFIVRGRGKDGRGKERVSRERRHEDATIVSPEWGWGNKKILFFVFVWKQEETYRQPAP